MPMSPKVFHYRSASRFRRFSSSSAFPLICLIFGLAGVLFGLFSITRPARKCPDVEPRAVSFMWDRNEGGGAGGGVAERHKVMGFVGIQTGFGSVGRRWAIRQTWLPADRQGLLRLEEATGLAFRFVIGKTKDKSKMAALQTEVNEYDDFMLIDIEEEYSNLPYKTYEPLSHLLGTGYFLHAYGPIYALSSDVVSSLVALRNNSFRMFSNEDVTIGSWMLAMNVNHENNLALCEPDCSSSSIAVWDIPRCSGLCNPEVKMLQLHKKEICSGIPKSSDE